MSGPARLQVIQFSVKDNRLPQDYKVLCQVSGLVEEGEQSDTFGHIWDLLLCVHKGLIKRLFRCFFKSTLEMLIDKSLFFSTFH